MKKILIYPALLLMITFMWNSDVSAQKMSKKLSFGLGIEAGIPTGNLAVGHSFGGGLTLRASYHVGPGFATLTAGGLVWVPKNLGGKDLSMSFQIPVKAGYKFIFKDHFFAMGEIGYNTFKAYTLDSKGDMVSYSQSGLVFAPGIGVQFKSVELGLRYEVFPIGYGLSGSMLGIRLGFNF